MKMLSRLIAGAMALVLAVAPALAVPQGSGPQPGASTTIILNGAPTTLGAALAARPTQAVTQRAPSATDDTAAGYKVGDLWRGPDGPIYQALQVAVGQAVWAPVPAARGLPTDIVAGATACYGNRALNSAWLNGSWIDVAATAGGTPTTLKFINGEPDIAGLNKVTGGGLGYASRWYDQCGSALDAVQTTAANQPVIRSDILTGGVPSTIFDSVIDFTPLVQKFMVLPSGLTVTGNADSAFAVVKSASASRPVSFFQLSNATFNQVFSANVGAFNGGQSKATLAYSNSAYAIGAPTLTDAVVGFTSSASAIAGWWNNDTASYAGRGAVTLAGGFIGASTSAAGVQQSTGLMEMSALVFYGRALSATEATNLRASLALNFRVPMQPQDVYVAAGDSITFGYGALALQSYPRKLLSILQSGVRLYNTGVSGSTIAQRITGYPTYEAKAYNPNAKNNIISLFFGTNDIAQNTTGSVTYDRLTQYISLAHATGFKVIVLTTLPRASFTTAQEAERITYNALTRSNSGGSYGAAGQWDALVDIASDPILGASASTANTSIYGDGTHPTDYSYNFIPPGVVNRMGGLLRQ